jgi:hypothetical protein
MRVFTKGIVNPEVYVAELVPHRFLGSKGAAPGRRDHSANQD